MFKKNRINLPRRQFLAGGTAAGAAVAGVGLGFAQRAQAGVNAQTKLLVYIFLRGGMDGLSFVIPTEGANHTNYFNARQATYVEPSNTLDLFNSGFGLHPNCIDLHQIRNRCAFIHAVGHPLNALTRSHFDAQEEIELGTPGSQTAQNGFLARYLETISHDPEAIFTAMASSSNTPVSLNGYPDVANIDSPGGFSPNTGRYADTHLTMLREMYNGAGELDLAGQATVDAVDLINSFDLDNYNSADGANPYPNTSIGNDLALIAQLWGLNLGISVATLDRGGWDTHNQQNTLPTNFGYGRNIREVSEAVRAFYSDLAARGRANDVAIVIQSEFGRQVSENGNQGTDHGFANPMVVINGQINGGMYGTFPGIAINQREGDAVVPTTDFRDVHSSVIDRIFDGGSDIGTIFPDASYNYSPIAFT